MTQTTAVTLLQTFCDRLAAGDVDGCLALFAPDVVVEAPYVPEPIPKRMEGLEAFAGPFAEVQGLFAAFRWTALEVHGTDDPALAFATGSSEITLVDGRPYTQDYVILLREQGGRIAGYREYMDPVRAGAALGGLASAPR